MRFIWKSTFLFVLFCGLVNFTHIFAQQYVIQKGDKLNITFWQEPELNTQTTVGQNGKIDLPVIGSVRAAGITPSQLSEQIIEQISRYKIKITQASVVVMEYLGNKIYVTGEVGSPGTYSFEVIPNLWRVLQEAGGLSESANLEKITIIRAGENAGEITQVDMTQYFEQGELTTLPRLNGGDTVHVPRIPSMLQGGTTPSPFISRNEIYILGEVASPGRYNLEKNIDLLDALILAGGPTQAAKLSDVRILKRWEGKRGMIIINLKKFLYNSEPGPPVLLPGDTIFVPRKAGVPSFLFTRIFVPVLTSVTVLLIVNTIR